MPLARFHPSRTICLSALKRESYATAIERDSARAGASPSGRLHCEMAGDKLPVVLGAVPLAPGFVSGAAKHNGVREGDRMEVNSIVIVSLISPKEKMWGQLLLLESKGVSVRGIELDAFDDFIRQVIQQEETAVSLNTVFFPMHRVERIAIDEPSGPIPSLAERFHSRAGITIQEYLGIQVPRA